MRAKFATLGLAVVVVVALAFEVSSVTFANQENANMAAAAKPRKKRARKTGQKRMMMSGVPMGVDKCLSHLAQMAAADPLVDYEGHPSEIINNGLLWNDPKSKCAVTDEAQRQKLFELANAWRMKDAAKVRSMLQEMGASGSGSGAEAAPAAEATPAADTTTDQPAAAPRKTRRTRKPARTKSAGTANTNSGF
jgi:hypothetical protein